MFGKTGLFQSSKDACILRENNYKRRKKKKKEKKKEQLICGGFFSSRARILGESWTNHSSPELFFVGSGGWGSGLSAMFPQPYVLSALRPLAPCSRSPTSPSPNPNPG